MQRLLMHYNSYRNLKYIYKKFQYVTFGRGVEIINRTNLVLGKNVSFQDRVMLHCGGVDWCDFKGGIEIGDNSVISPNCIFWGCGSKITIGKNFDCGPGVKIFASRTKYEELTKYPEINKHVFEDVIIGDNVILYTNVVIGPGVKIGDGAVVGANSMVLSNVEPYTLVAGSPAKFIKNRI
ncbi:MAG: acyltransferase [Bacteroidia bacterium]|nr:acyltransferase [Bacteroidia bacterium]